MERSYSAFVLRRIVAAIPLLLAIITVNFFLIRLAPGDPLVMIIGEASQYDAAFVHEVRVRFGLDQPLYRQYVSYVGRALQGDLGTSFYFDQQPVLDVVLSRLPQTALLLCLGF